MINEKKYKITINSESYKWFGFKRNLEFWTDHVIYDTYEDACKALIKNVSMIINPIYLMIDEMIEDGTTNRYYISNFDYKRLKAMYRNTLEDFIFHKDNNSFLHKLTNLKLNFKI